MATSVSVFGLGLMGRPMARILIKAGWPVLGWNRSSLSSELISGIPLSEDLETAAKSDVCLLMVSDSEAVAAVLEWLAPYLSPGQLVLDMGTSEPERSREHAEQLAERGVGWVDAPVSGGPEGAAAGTLVIMAGGTDVDFTRAKPILDTLGGNVVHVGSPGTGHLVKVINQLIVGLMIEAVAEGLTLAERAGVKPQLVQQALKGGLADSSILQIHGTRMVNRSYTPGGHVKTQLKDLKMALRLAESVSVNLPHLRSTIARYEMLMEQGNSHLDHSALHKLFWS